MDDTGRGRDGGRRADVTGGRGAVPPAGGGPAAGRPAAGERGRLWTPSPDRVAASRLTGYARWLAATRGRTFGSYDDLWRWSTEDIEGFWDSIWEYFGVRAHAPFLRVLREPVMPGADWFPGARLNFAEHALARRDAAVAVIACREDPDAEGGLTVRRLTHAELAWQVAAAAAGLRGLGVGRGDRVAAVLPNAVEALVAFLATASLGAVWSSCSPEFGVPSVIDRFRQITPRVLIAAEAYRYGGRLHDRRAALGEIERALPGLAATVVVPGPDEGPPSGGGRSVRRVAWADLPAMAGQAPRMAQGGGPAAAGRATGAAAWGAAAAAGAAGRVAGAGAVPAAGGWELRFEPVPFGHPLWILYSSGTTGLPKPIVQGHGGILLEQLKLLALHLDAGADDRFFWFTTTGWMMWNVVVSALLVGAGVVLYDGSPGHPDWNALWRLAAATGVTCFGTSAAHLAACRRAGVEPGAAFDLKALRTVGSTGSPLSPEGFRWVYEHVKQDVLLASISGGTDLCTAFAVSCPWLPVHAGEIQCRALGARIEAWDAGGAPLRDEVGELVITRPMPSMPLFLWNDEGGRRYRESYFETYPGVWRHGDWVRLTADGGLVISGRSDATLNRGGIRTGSAEFYRVVEAMPEVADSLVVDTGEPSAGEGPAGATGSRGPGGFGGLWLFVVPSEGACLDAGLSERIRERLRAQLSPRHVPDHIHALAEVPRTLNGKKLEVPVKRILLGASPDDVVSRGALANPDALTPFVELVARRSERDRPGE